ncbi:MAG: hypothetical protein ACRDMI_10130 [Streptosporangiaceae bacterium]
MSVVPLDYDSDPGRFLADGEFPHHDVLHPHVQPVWPQPVRGSPWTSAGVTASWPGYCRPRP